MKHYDLAIIGAGPGGYVAALYASRRGLSVCLIERSLLGGTCLNCGCIPTKAMLHVSELLFAIRSAAAFGVKGGEAAVDAAALFSRRDSTVARLRAGVAYLLKSRKVDILQGSAVIGPERSITVAGEAVSAKKIILAVGSLPSSLPSLPFDSTRILSSDDLLRLTSIPKSLIIVGGGVIGCEFAQFYARAGSAVTILEIMQQLLPSFSPEIGKRMERVLKKDGVTVMTGSGVASAAVKASGVTVKVSDGATLDTDVVLVAVGRQAATKNMGLAEAGVEVDERGRIVVKADLSTSVEGVYAIGDCIGEPMLAHKASFEGVLAVDAILGRARSFDRSAVPSCIYTDPSVAVAGIGEEEARRRSPGSRAVKFPFTALSKATVDGRTEGFIKLIADGEGKVLGVEIFGHGACELIAVAAAALRHGLSVEALADVVYPHPTFSEAIGEAAHLFEGGGIHSA